MKFLCIFILSSLSFTIHANNILVSNVSLSNQNTATNTSMVNLDLSWSNSWRTSTLESNWDAAWVFIKFRRTSNTFWEHAILNTTGHVAAAGSTITTPTDGTGSFLYRNTDGIGNVAFSGIQLQWNYGANGLQDYDSVELCVFAIEMVYVPQGSFNVGDGLSAFGQLENELTGLPASITSENALTLGGGTAGSIGNNNATGMTPVDDFTDVTGQTLPAAFPKGYNAYYIMKYEVSQELYVNFLNKLTRTQQTNRFNSTTVGSFYNNLATISNRNGIKLLSDPGGANPRVYGNDLNNNGTTGDVNDGQNIACNWLSAGDHLALLDWCGLRPMSELEYEKACRGNLASLSGEYAWGTVNLTQSTGITNSGQGNELSSNSASNAVASNVAAVGGPMRSGNFAQVATDRQSSGGTYFGVMEMTGNLWELTIKIGSTQGRAFTGTHGDGILDVNGQRTNADWGNFTGTVHAISLRGGSWANTTADVYTTSGRRNANWNGNAGTRTNNTGSRGVRIAPLINDIGTAMRILFFFTLLQCVFGDSFAQNNAIFSGGSNDGDAFLCYQQSSATLNNAIFSGGINDGASSDCFAQLAAVLSNSIFSGGANNGIVIDCYQQVQAQLNNLIFRGGNSIQSSVACIGTITEEPLPLEMVYQLIECDEELSYLKWGTEWELNLAYFSIEQSYDGENFDWLKNVPATGSFGNAQSYSIPLPFHNNTEQRYYRLVSYDLDGKQSYSEVISDINCVSGKSLLTNYYFSDQNLSLKFSDKARTFTLISPSGQRVMKTTSIDHNQTFIQIEVNFNQGVYLLYVTNEAQDIQEIYRICKIAP